MFQTPYMDLKDKIRPKTENKKPTMTKQALKDDADVNKIIKRYKDTGLKLDAAEFEGIYGDFDGIDYRQALDTITAADELFMRVPSHIRKHFDHDPGAFIDFATDDKNTQQMIDWGLAIKPPQKLDDDVPVKVEITNPPTE